ncbi:MAG TPA: class I SAM-dependent methyltransferase [Pyrinomonadaceae bacterium]|nr:class I SAM-dependent methyltransferase [Pyrinomonadaceae bacterium]
MIDFEKAIDELDLELFAQIPSQSTDEDKRSLLACELAVRELAPDYNYLEIGSYLGGSIQPHLLDEKCRRIYSIDKRPASQPDERGYDWHYLNNSTKRMLEMLAQVSDDTEKITTIDGDTGSIDPNVITEKIQLCFIDGEHTDESVVSDFMFCLQVLDDNGAIVFHDAQITYNGIASCLRHLEELGVKFRAYVLPHIVFVVEIGEFPMHRNPTIMERLIDNHKSYLFSLQENDQYRRFATRFPFGALKRLRLKLRGGNVSQ